MPLDPTTYKIPTGFEKINGALYKTSDAQRAAFDNIQVIGTLGSPDAYLIGKPKTAPAPGANLPSSVPAGFVQIPGALYPTQSLQEGAFSDIMQIGKSGQPGSYLVGKPRNTSLSLPGGGVDVNGSTGQVTPGTDIPPPPGTPSLGDIKKTSESGTSADAITHLIETFETQNKEYQQQILAQLAPTSQENDLQKQIDELNSRLKQGLVNIEGKPIPLEDMAGQEAQLNRNVAALLDPLNSALGRAQTQRQGILSRLTTALGFQKDSQDLQLKAAQEMQKPLLEANKLVQDYVTDLAKKYPDAGIMLTDTAQSAAAKVAKSAIYQKSIAEGQGAADPTSYREWELAGKPGTYADFLKARQVGPPTVDQVKNAGFAIRMQDSGAIIDKFSFAAAGLAGAGQAALPDSVFTNWLKSSEFQQLEQAERDFVNSVLRRESGAVISNQEFDNAKKQYFPQAGDSEATIAQKKANRLNALRGIVLSSGNALSPDFLANGQQQEEGGNGGGGGTAGVDVGAEIAEARAQGYSDREIYDYLVNKKLITPPANFEVEPKAYLDQLAKKKVSVTIPKSSRLSYINNNPGNLRFVGQRGASQGEGGFAKFPTPEAGYRALIAQIELDKTRNHTLSSFITKFAPPSENDTVTYIKQIAKALGIEPGTKLSEIPTTPLAAAMAKKESSSNVEYFA